MKHRIYLTAGTASLSLILLANPAWAERNPHQHDNSYQDHARVISSTPQYQQVNHPRQVCHTDYVTQQTTSSAPVAHSYGGAVVGGITGALVGSRFGKGHGKEGAIAAGAIAGALLGDSIQGQRHQTVSHRQHRQPVERCYSEDNWHSEISGYEVVYKYKGQRYRTFMNEKPGRKIAVKVQVTPLHEQRYARHQQRR